MYISRYVVFDESSFPFHQMVSNPFPTINSTTSSHFSSHITLSYVTFPQINNDKYHQTSIIPSCSSNATTNTILLDLSSPTSPQHHLPMFILYKPNQNLEFSPSLLLNILSHLISLLIMFHLLVIKHPRTHCHAPIQD